MYVIKKDNTHEPWNVQKVVVAVNKSAYRALVKFTQEELDFICDFVETKAKSLGKEGIPIAEMHNIVEGALEQVKPEVAKSYRDYRNYKQTLSKCWTKFTKKASPSCTSVTKKTATPTALWFPQNALWYSIS